MFSEITQSAFNQAFRFTRLSRKRLHDKKFIIDALEKSSIIKNTLYKFWLSNRSTDDEIKYKQLRTIFKETAVAEKSHYQEMFDAKNNSVTQL
jgi:hypothetical protein